MRQEAAHLGIGEALLKPVDPDELLRVIARQCRRGHGRDAQ
jgi:hypothetical protein